MVTLNKVEVAAQMFMEAHERYERAERDIDYIVSIVLTGAVIGIVSPLLEEQGGHTTHSLLARIGKLLAEPGEKIHEGVFRAVYNALHHAGHTRRGIAPSADLEIQTDLRIEAARMLDAAKQDFVQIKVMPNVRDALPAEFVRLLEAGESYEQSA